jgi:RHS repeat-associated protein
VVTYIHTDGLGSPVARTGSAGTLICRTRYEPYGLTAGGATPTIGFTGHVNDLDTGLVYMQQRYYDPVAGRFLSIDPVDVAAGGNFNRFGYARENPYEYVDPDGRDEIQVVVITGNRPDSPPPPPPSSPPPSQPPVIHENVLRPPPVRQQNIVSNFMCGGENGYDPSYLSRVNDNYKRTMDAAFPSWTNILGANPEVALSAGDVMPLIGGVTWGQAAASGGSTLAKNAYTAAALTSVATGALVKGAFASGALVGSFVSPWVICPQ